MLPLLTVLVLALMGAFIGENQVLCDLEEIPLTMAPDSYDDQYIGCPSTMENKLMDLTTDGFKAKYDFIWKNATNYWNKIQGSLQLPNGFKDEYGIALVAYSACSKLYLDFNTAVREGGKSSTNYENYFHFKSFHFLLTKAVQALKTSQPDCYYVYRGIKKIRFTVPDENNPVRFGQFSSSSLSEKVARDIGEDTLFTIETCLGVQISDFSYFPHQQEILIPPYETFMFIKGQNNDKSQINLIRNYESSNFNCQSKRGKKPTLTHKSDQVTLAPFLMPGSR
uniref:NAD(P)(+)--arginine ADP-ribosyltransferase n=1 Tax=Anolis carolinensis TaxID=28377 RepID=H9GUK1_ANOCA|nr:PREDICTED: NAD(P)(+)--arginine ADP-ribosyltransferase 2-like [Anolis carolinensis]|eukprot:XP_008121371.1 PREDICTED: NAD(P)(+)--arginine ADP-ribosyltransferase 2-like [Anolis carolinensis]